MRFSAYRRTLLAALLVPALGACNDEPDFGFGDWEASEESDSTTLYSVDVAEHQSRPGVYDIVNTRALRIEEPGATGQWDFALTGGVDGPLTLTPLGAFFDVDNSAGLHVVTDNSTFEELDRAPSEDADYVTDSPVALDVGSLYVVRSRSSGNCVKFAKLEPTAVDQEAGTFSFRLTRNPNCNDTDLVPPEDD